jgi:hypothetical protein
VLAILVGAELGGLPGIFLAIPSVGLIMVGYNHYKAYKRTERLRGDTDTGRLSDIPQGEITVEDTSPLESEPVTINHE